MGVDVQMHNYPQFTPLINKQPCGFSNYWDVQPPEFVEIIKEQNVFIRYEASHCQGQVYWDRVRDRIAVAIYVKMELQEVFHGQDIDEIIREIQEKYGED